MLPMDLRWEEPPETLLFRNLNRGGKYVDFALALMERPGTWAIMPTDDIKTEKSIKHTAQNIRRGSIKGFTKGEFEAVEDGTTIWVRWIGKAKQEPEGDAEGGEPEDPEDDGSFPPGSDEERMARQASDFAAQARVWAKENGLTVNDRGRMPREIIERYARETSQLLPQAYRR